MTRQMKLWAWHFPKAQTTGVGRLIAQLELNDRAGKDIEQAGGLHFGQAGQTAPVSHVADRGLLRADEVAD